MFTITSTATNMSSACICLIKTPYWKIDWKGKGLAVFYYFPKDNKLEKQLVRSSFTFVCSLSNNLWKNECKKSLMESNLGNWMLYAKYIHFLLPSTKQENANVRRKIVIKSLLYLHLPLKSATS